MAKESENFEEVKKMPSSILSRRKMLGAIGLSGAGLIISCKNGGSSSDSQQTISENETGTESTTETETSTPGSCVLIPSETAGPFPLTAILNNTAMVRSDITEGKSGIPLRVILNVVDINDDCSAMPYSSVYLWHCDIDGVYSGYSNQSGGVNAIGETFCRGIQDSDENGQVIFDTVYPGWYAGRITHLHFQVFLYNGTTATATSQLAFPQTTTTEVYNSALYASRGQNTSVGSFNQDNVFRDGVAYQMAEVTGNVNDGYVATLQIGIANQ